MDSSPTELVPFAAATAVKPIGDGQYTSAVDPSWDGPLSTHGGVLASIALNAVDAEVNADQALHPRTFSCHYLRPPAHGEVTVAVRQLRAGRRVVSSAFELLSEGRLCVTGLVSHVVRGLPEVASWMPILPDVAPQPQRDAGCIAPDDFRRKCGKWVEFPPQAPKFLQQMLICPQFGDPIMGGPPVENGEGTENGGWLTLPDANPVTPALLATYVDAWWPSALQPLRKPAMAPTLDLTVHFRSELPPEGLADQPVLVHNTSIALIDGMCDSDSKIFTADGTLLAQARQLQLVIPLT